MSDALDSSIRWPQLTKLNLDMLKVLEQRGQLKPECSQEDAQAIYHYLLFPLYAFDFAESRNFRDLPPSDSPYDYHWAMWHRTGETAGRSPSPGAHDIRHFFAFLV